jgi:uncharacterized membrane-anchored protein YjiN (DUF445 family)
MENFQGDIKKWVSLDSQLKTLNDSVKEIRNERNELADNIFDFVEENNLSTSTIKISDGKLKFAQNKQTSPITLGFLENCLTDLFHDEVKVDQIMTYIKDKREIKMVPDIKRYYSN